jgi:squalene-hopene/tetraprenyl-beta-curcumene cyclase
VERACCWLLAAQNQDGGWGGDAGTPSSIEETSLSLEALSTIVLSDPTSNSLRPSRSPVTTGNCEQEALQRALRRGAAWLCHATDVGGRFPPAPIGLYFAKLWYDEKLYPLIFSVAAFRRLKMAVHGYNDGAWTRAVSLVSSASTSNSVH